jgi:hypothetical protein
MAHAAVRSAGLRGAAGIRANCTRRRRRGATQHRFGTSPAAVAAVIAVILILRTSFAFAVFEEILAITQGGPGDAWVSAWYSYKVSFAPPFNIGLAASAMSWR